MSSNAETIKSFLVGLGFKVDENGMKRFARSVAIQTEVVQELADGLKEAAIKIVDFARDTAEAMDQMYFASQRVKSSAANLQALSYAAKQSGVSVDSMSSAIESLHKFMVTNPMSDALLNGLHVDTRDSNGQLRDTADIFKDLKKSLADMPAYRANSYAGMFGIDWKLLNASTESIDKFSAEYKAMTASLGLDADKAANSGNKFETSLRRIRGWFELLGEKAGSELADKLQQPLNDLAGWLISHGPEIGKLMDRIIASIERMLPVILNLGKFAAKYIGELISWFNNLPGPVKVVLGVLLGLIPVAAALGVGIMALGAVITAIGTIAGVAAAAFGVLDVAMGIALAPVTLITAAIAGLVAGVGFLIHDFNTWKETGKSFLPWNKWKPEIDGAVAGIEKLIDKTKTYFGLHASTSAGSPTAARGIRNNNPGNIEAGHFTATHGATGVEAAGRFATFATAQAGLDALASLLKSYASRGIDTIRSIISKYAPKGENNTAAYITGVAKKLGVDANSHLDLSNPEVLTTMMKAVTQIENGKNPYSTGMYDLAASRAGAGPASITIHQTNTTTVTGSSDPVATGQEVARGFTKNSADLFRGLQSRLS